MQIRIEELKDMQIFIYNNIKCVSIGLTINDYYIITPIPSEIPDKESQIHTLFWRAPHAVDQIQQLIDNQPVEYKTGYYFGIPNTYLVLTNNEFLEIKEVPHDKNYLFPSIESL